MSLSVQLERPFSIETTRRRERAAVRVRAIFAARRADTAHLISGDRSRHTHRSDYSLRKLQRVEISPGQETADIGDYAYVVAKQKATSHRAEGRAKLFRTTQLSNKVVEIPAVTLAVSAEAAPEPSIEVSQAAKLADVEEKYAPRHSAAPMDEASMPTVEHATHRRGKLVAEQVISETVVLDTPQSALAADMVEMPGYVATPVPPLPGRDHVA